MTISLSGFTRVFGRIMHHTYIITALVLAFAYIEENAAYHEAMFTIARAQARALIIMSDVIASGLKL